LKRVTSELEAIEYFNALNNTKAQNWSDPVLVANKYISELEKAFNKEKILLIRPGATKRPYLSVETLRDVLLLQKLKESDVEIKAFIARVIEYNTQSLKTSDILLSHCKAKDAHSVQRGIDIQFMLALNPKLPWIALSI